MTKVNVMEMRNIEGGARCPGCNKSYMFGTLWFHKMFCHSYQSKRHTDALKKMWK